MSQPNSPEYNSWRAMIRRCYLTSQPGYANYGGRGIVVCERWLNSFRTFRSDIGLRPSSEHTVDRINVNGNYEPSNCRWATRAEQNSNRRDNVMLSVNGETASLAEWSRRAGRSKSTIQDRLKLGWSHRDAVMEPANCTSRKYRGVSP